MCLSWYLGRCLIIISKINPLSTNYYYSRRHICNNFLHFGYNKTKQNQMKIIEKLKHFSCDSRNIQFLHFGVCPRSYPLSIFEIKQYIENLNR